MQARIAKTGAFRLHVLQFHDIARFVIVLDVFIIFPFIFVGVILYRPAVACTCSFHVLTVKSETYSSCSEHRELS